MNYDISKVHEGEVFKSFNELYYVLTGKKISGGYGKKTAEKYIDTLLEYADEKSKYAIRITKIYAEDERPKIKDGRGKNGDYCTQIRNLILSKSKFNGKAYEFFSEYNVLESLTAASIVFYGNPYTNASSKAEKNYRHFIWRAMNTALKNSLDVLQDEGKISYDFYYCITPSIEIDIEDSHLKDLKNIVDHGGFIQKRADYLETFQSMENFTLDVNSLEILDVQSMLFDWSGDYAESYDDYCQAVLDAGKLLPIRLSKKQENVLTEIMQFAKQVTYSEHLRTIKDDKLMTISESEKAIKHIPGNTLWEKYESKLKEVLKVLANIKAHWQELSYTTNEEYVLTETDTQAEAAELSSALFSKVMTNSLDKETEVTAAQSYDFEASKFGYCKTRKLKESKSVSRLYSLAEKEVKGK